MNRKMKPQLLSSFTADRVEAGCDEAGRGCLAGPVFAAAVILPKNFTHEFLNDSKKLPVKQRNSLRILIEKEALAWSVARVDADEIDRINILNASFLAMHLAIDRLSLKPELLLIDGNRFRTYPGISHTCIVKGDGKYFSIAAASVLAKTHRDEFMLNLDKQFPQYNWKKNMGYPTRKHREGIQQFGVSPVHRMSYNLLGPLKMDLNG
jgi:ribonuclease HII